MKVIGEKATLRRENGRRAVPKARCGVGREYVVCTFVNKGWRIGARTLCQEPRETVHAFHNSGKQLCQRQFFISLVPWARNVVQVTCQFMKNGPLSVIDHPLYLAKLLAGILCDLVCGVDNVRGRAERDAVSFCLYLLLASEQWPQWSCMDMVLYTLQQKVVLLNAHAIVR